MTYFIVIFTLLQWPGPEPATSPSDSCTKWKKVADIQDTPKQVSSSNSKTLKAMLSGFSDKFGFGCHCLAKHSEIWL